MPRPRNTTGASEPDEAPPGASGVTPPEESPPPPAINEEETYESAAARRLAELEAENAELRRAVAAAGIRIPGKPPRRPKYGMTEGTRQELADTGRAVDPFTGEPLGDWTDVPGHRKDYGLPEGVEAADVEAPPLVRDQDKP